MREDEVKSPNNFYSALEQPKPLERPPEKYDTLRKRYQETIDTDVNLVMSAKLNNLN